MQGRIGHFLPRRVERQTHSKLMVPKAHGQLSVGFGVRGIASVARCAVSSDFLVGDAIPEYDDGQVCHYQ